MRRTVPTLLLAAVLCAPLAFPKDNNAPFDAPSAHDTVCLAPVLDLRPDKSTPLYLSTSPGKSYAVSADEAFSRAWSGMQLRYKTMNCGPVDATLDELNAPSEALIRKLDFGQQRWLFVLVVEDYIKSTAKVVNVGSSQALVSIFFFDKQGGTGLVWHHTTTGKQNASFAVPAFAKNIKELQDTTRSSMAIQDAANRLAVAFWRAKDGKPPQKGY